MAGRGVHAARTRVQGNVFAQNHQGSAVVEGMPGFQTFQGGAGRFAQHGVFGPPEQGGAGGQQFFGQHVLRPVHVSQDINKTTIVRIIVPRFDSTPEMPTLPRIDVSAANTADAAA